MDIARDELRRQLRSSRREQADALGPFREALLRFFDGSRPRGVPGATHLLGLPRRRFLTVGGLTVLTAAVVAACGDDEDEAVPRAGQQTTTSTTIAPVIDDLTLLRTASSLELAAVAAYDGALGVLDDEAVADAARLFQAQHAEHAALFVAATTNAGGDPYEDPNPVVMADVVEPALAAIAEDPSDQAVLRFAYALENVAASTYQSTMRAFTIPALRQAAMSVGGVEARHAAILASLIEGAVVVAGLEADESGAAGSAAGDGEGEDDGSAEGDASTADETEGGGDEESTGASGSTGTDEEAVVYAQVPGPFQSVLAAIGPASYIYSEPPAG